MRRLVARALLALAALALLAPATPAAAAEHGREGGAEGGLAALLRAVDARAEAATPQVVAWRRDIHAHPELGNREERTAALVAEHLRGLGLDEVRTGVAHTGVVGVLRGGRPGGVVALRADMDALPVTEQTGLPFASTVRTTYEGREVGVMHACGHDAHTAILMGVARVLAGVREEIPGTVLFLFQPAEEGAPEGEEGGARLMLAEGAFEDPRPDAVFGLHVVPQYEAGEIALLAGGAMAGSDKLAITVRGSQTHAAYPWMGVDPIAAASRVVLALHALPARRLDVRRPSVVSIGVVEGGVRYNIVPDEVRMRGTIRHLDPAMQETLHARIREAARHAAATDGAEADVEITVGYPVTWNDPALVKRIRPALARVAGEGLVRGLPRTGAEDFAFLAREVPGVYFWLGIREPGVPEDEAAPNHSPRFVIDESALPLGVRALSHVAVDFLRGTAPAPGGG